jgi:hypothetical protein
MEQGIFNIIQKTLDIMKDFEILVRMIVLPRVSEIGFLEIISNATDNLVSFKHKSNDLEIKLEQYRGEVYVCFVNENSNKEVSLFNLLYFLNQNSQSSPKSKFFEDEGNLHERLKKQLIYISDTIIKHFEVIDQFFKRGEFETCVSKIDEFMINKFPFLFKSS